MERDGGRAAARGGEALHQRQGGGLLDRGRGRAEADEQEDTAEGAAEWTTAEPEPEEFLQYVDWDRFEAEQGVEAAGQGVEAAEQGVGAAEQGVAA